MDLKHETTAKYMRAPYASKNCKHLKTCIFKHVMYYMFLYIGLVKIYNIHMQFQFNTLNFWFLNDFLKLEE